MQVAEHSGAWLKTFYHGLRFCHRYVGIQINIFLFLILIESLQSIKAR